MIWIGTLYFSQKLDVVLQPVVGAVRDLVDREGRHFLLGMLGLVLSQLAGDALQPFLEHFLRPRVQRRERADDAGLALLDPQVRIGDDEQRRSDCREERSRAAEPEEPCVLVLFLFHQFVGAALVEGAL